jgi:DNA-directed RNA polymerase specialized sigma24 family protein
MLAYRHRSSLRGDSRFTTWLYRIAATTAFMHVRKQRRRAPGMCASRDELEAEPERLVQPTAVVIFSAVCCAPHRRRAPGAPPTQAALPSAHRPRRGRQAAGPR